MKHLKQQVQIKSEKVDLTLANAVACVGFKTSLCVLSYNFLMLVEIVECEKRYKTCCKKVKLLTSFHQHTSSKSISTANFWLIMTNTLYHSEWNQI